MKPPSPPSPAQPTRPAPVVLPSPGTHQILTSVFPSLRLPIHRYTNIQTSKCRCCLSATIQNPDIALGGRGEEQRVPRNKSVITENWKYSLKKMLRPFEVTHRPLVVYSGQTSSRPYFKHFNRTQTKRRTKVRYD